MTTSLLNHKDGIQANRVRFIGLSRQKLALIGYLLIGALMAITAYLYLQNSNIDSFWTWYFEYSPNRYRLMQQILLRLSSGFLPLSTLHVIVWWISISLTFIIIRPNVLETLGLSLLGMMMSVQLLILSAPGYVLFSLFCKTRDYKYSILLLPCIILFKEVLFYSALMVMLLLPSSFSRRQLRTRIVIGSILSALAYGAMIIIMGLTGAAPGGTPLVTIFYVIQVLQTSWLTPAVVFTGIILFSFIFVVRRRKDLLIILLLVIPAFVLGFFWEPQLWLPAMIALIYGHQNRNWVGSEHECTTR